MKGKRKETAENGGAIIQARRKLKPKRVLELGQVWGPKVARFQATFGSGCRKKIENCSVKARWEDDLSSPFSNIEKDEHLEMARRATTTCAAHSAPQTPGNAGANVPE